MGVFLLGLRGASPLLSQIVIANSEGKTAPESCTPGLSWRMVDYDDEAGISEALAGIHTLLSFVQPLADMEGCVQKTFVNAAILAGVKRFAPSKYRR